ncbi:DUF3618 domain-containing protein [Mesorhizobium sp. LNHC252B00]|uniref:DUF3618 domain-containing protein n=1 Tax=Mesorhizobium sp. LNHC252B00 TaxID=1287252 RepID=UPI0018DB27E7|nr:DUF3618 domain-containing protein [Mesorhizobium sp. LNHC252B00]
MQKSKRGIAMTYTEQLERETERIRSQLVDTLDELRASVTPGQILDQFSDYAGRGDAGEFYRGLRHQMARNPLPVTLIGAGIAWLMCAGPANGRAADIGTRPKPEGSDLDRMSDKIGAVADSVTEAGAAAGSQIRDAAGRLGAAAGENALSAAASVSRTASSTYDAVADSTSRTAMAIGGSARSLGHSLASTTQSLLNFCRNEPLVLAGIGLAVGAAIGAALPPSEVEDPLIRDKPGGATEDPRSPQPGRHRQSGDGTEQPTPSGEKEVAAKTKEEGKEPARPAVPAAAAEPDTGNKAASRENTARTPQAKEEHDKAG